MIRPSYMASVFPTAVGVASLNSRSIRCTSDDLAYGVTTAMSVLIYRRFGGSGYLSPSLAAGPFTVFLPRAPLSLSLPCSLRRLSFPFALIRHFLPCSGATGRGEEARKREEAKERPLQARSLDRSTRREGGHSLGECTDWRC